MDREGVCVLLIARAVLGKNGGSRKQKRAERLEGDRLTKERGTRVRKGDENGYLREDIFGSRLERNPWADRLCGWADDAYWRAYRS